MSTRQAKPDVSEKKAFDQVIHPRNLFNADIFERL